MNVLDTSAVLAALYGEAGAQPAKAMADGALLSIVNFAEVATDYIRSGAGTPTEAEQAIDGLGLTLAPPTSEQARRAAELKRVRGLSLGDCFCIALGEAQQAPLVTADRLWATVDNIRTPIHLIR